MQICEKFLSNSISRWIEMHTISDRGFIYPSKPDEYAIIAEESNFLPGRIAVVITNYGNLYIHKSNKRGGCGSKKSCSLTRYNEGISLSMGKMPEYLLRIFEHIRENYIIGCDILSNPLSFLFNMVILPYINHSLLLGDNSLLGKIESILMSSHYGFDVSDVARLAEPEYKTECLSYTRITKRYYLTTLYNYYLVMSGRMAMTQMCRIEPSGLNQILYPIEANKLWTQPKALDYSPESEYIVFAVETFTISNYGNLYAIVPGTNTFSIERLDVFLPEHILRGIYHYMNEISMNTDELSLSPVGVWLKVCVFPFISMVYDGVIRCAPQIRTALEFFDKSADEMISIFSATMLLDISQDINPQIGVDMFSNYIRTLSFCKRMIANINSRQMT